MSVPSRKPLAEPRAADQVAFRFSWAPSAALGNRQRVVVAGNAAAPGL